MSEDGFWFIDRKTSRREWEVFDGMQRVYFDVIFSIDEKPKNLPDGDWVPIEFRHNLSLDGGFVNGQRDATELFEEHKAKGYCRMGWVQGWRKAHPYRKYYIYEQPLKREVRRDESGNYFVKRYLAYEKDARGKNLPNRERWYLWEECEATALTEWKEEVYYDMARQGYWEFSTELPYPKSVVDWLSPTETTFYLYRCPSRDKEGDGITLGCYAWTKDPEGKNLPGGPWKFVTILKTYRWETYKHWDLEEVTKGVGSDGYHIGWMEVVDIKPRVDIQFNESRPSDEVKVGTESQSVQTGGRISSAIDRVLNRNK